MRSNSGEAGGYDGRKSSAEVTQKSMQGSKHGVTFSVPQKTAKENAETGGKESAQSTKQGIKVHQKQFSRSEKIMTSIVQSVAANQWYGLCCL